MARALFALGIAVTTVAGCSSDDPTPSTPPPVASSGAGGASTVSAGGAPGTGGNVAQGGSGGSGEGGAGGAPADPCATRPPLSLTSGFDVLYGNANPTPETFVGTTPWIEPFDMPFPNDSGIAKRIRLARDHYAAIEFDTTDIASTSGRFDTDNPQITTDTGLKLMAISPCPGDFAAPLDDPDCRRRLGPVGNLAWSFDDEPFSCRIERDRTYYLNIIFTEDEELPVTWACNLSPDAPNAEQCLMLFNTTFN